MLRNLLQVSACKTRAQTSSLCHLMSILFAHTFRLPKRNELPQLRELRGGNIEAFYLNATLSYGHYLWLKGYSGRAILAITRALYANFLPGKKSFANGRSHIEPYIGSSLITLAKIILGNPRISFQHQATRLRGDRVALRRMRAWAVWKLILPAKPSCLRIPLKVSSNPILTRSSKV